MARNLSTFSFKKLPAAFLLTVLLIAALEGAVFSRAWIFADWNTLVILHKKEILKQRQGAEVVFFGDSLLWSVDGKAMETALGRGRVYNYYLTNLGAGFNLSLIFRQYLKYKEKPEIIFLAVKPHYFYHPGGLEFQKDYQVVQFRRYVEPFILAANLPFSEMKNISARMHLISGFLGVVKEYLLNSLPSRDYRILLRQLGPPFLLAGDVTREWFVWTPHLNQLRENQNLLTYLDQSNGQLKMDSFDTVPADQAGTELADEWPVEITNPDIERIVQLARDRQIRVVFFWMPIWEERYKMMGGARYFAPIEAHLRDLEGRYSNFEIESLTPRLYPRDHFIDAIHLNARGTGRFNAEFAPRFAALAAPHFREKN